jgi:hypothetical protein
MTELSENDIVQALAEHDCRQITRRTILNLQSINMEEALLSGKESGLHNTWDEVCVQFQDDFWLCWDVYETTIRAVVESLVEELQPHEREAIWLQTEDGYDWMYEDKADRDPYPVISDTIVDYLLRTYIYAEADKWTNRRIRKYMYRLSMCD